MRRDDFLRNYVLARYSPAALHGGLVRQFTWEGSYDYFENGAGMHRDANRPGHLRHRVREQRSVQRQLRAALRLRAAGRSTRPASSPSRSASTTTRASSSPTPWDSSAGCRARCRCGAADYYHGEDQRGRLPAGPRGDHAPVLAGAGPVGQPHLAAGRRDVHRAAGYEPRHLYVHAPDVLRRRSFSTARSATPSAPISGCGGSTSRAASCLSSTTTSATWRTSRSAPGAGRSCGTARS